MVRSCRCPWQGDVGSASWSCHVTDMTIPPGMDMINCGRGRPWRPAPPPRRWHRAYRSGYCPGWCRGEQPGVLQYHADHGAEDSRFMSRTSTPSMVISFLPSRRKTKNQIDQRGFTGSGGAHNGNFVSRSPHGDPGRGSTAGHRVSELHVVEVHISLRLFGNCCLDLGHSSYPGIQRLSEPPWSPA